MNRDENDFRTFISYEDRIYFPLEEKEAKLPLLIIMIDIIIFPDPVRKHMMIIMFELPPLSRKS